MKGREQARAGESGSKLPQQRRANAYSIGLRHDARVGDRVVIHSAGALECGSLLPLLLRPACWPGLGTRTKGREQARAGESGSKLPHSKAPPFQGMARNPNYCRKMMIAGVPTGV
jgi:hypothetical protein